MPTLPSSRFRSWDRLLILVLLSVVALITSFPARNADIWQHLALGRLVAGGQYDFATDPLGFPTGSVRWVNHHWLADWGSYQLFRTADGQALVVSKVLLIVGLVVLGLRTLRSDQPRWLAVVALLLAMIAFSARATLQPLMLSSMLLAILFRLFHHGGTALRLVPILMLFWVNLDEWFLLGQIVLLIHCANRRWCRANAVSVWIPLASLGACFLSPFHVFGLTLPTEVALALSGTSLARSPLLLAQFPSLITAGSFLRDHAGNVGFWCTLAMLVTGGVMSLVLRKRLTLPAITTWWLVAALAVWQVRLVPLAAVAFLFVFVPSIQAITPQVKLRWLGRSVALLLLLGTGVLSWFGLLHGPRGRERSWGWSVHADASLVEAAKTLKQWRQSGLLPSDQYVLTVSPDAASVLMWFADGEPSALDTRWALHVRADQFDSWDLASEFGISDQLSSTRSQLIPFKSWHIGTALLPEPSLALLMKITAPDSPWRIIQTDGHCVWLVRKPTADLDAIDHWPAANTLAPAPRQNAFGTDNPREHLPVRLPVPAPWWWPAAQLQTESSLETHSADLASSLQFATEASDAAWSILALRSARAAVLAKPDDATAWLALARAYTLLSTTVENRLAPKCGLLAELRRVQRMTALTQAAALQPDLEAAADGLASTYQEAGYLDRAIRERRRQLALVQRRGDTERLIALRDNLAQLERDLFDREALFQVRTQRMSGEPLQRSRIAFNLGLANLAQDILLKSSPDLYGREGIQFLAELLIGTGQATEALTLLNREELKRNPAQLGIHDVPSFTDDGKRILFRIPAFDWFRFLLAAALDHEDPRLPLSGLQQTLTAELSTVSAFHSRLSPGVSTQVLFEVGMAATSPTALSRIIIQLQQDQLLSPVRNSRLLLVERADLAVLEGVWLIERGQRTLARQRLEAALADYETAREFKVFPAKALAEAFLDDLRKDSK